MLAGTAGDRPRAPAPVGSELEGHDDAADHAHAEGEREPIEPEVEHAPVDGIIRHQSHSLKHH